MHMHNLEVREAVCMCMPVPVRLPPALTHPQHTLEALEVCLTSGPETGAMRAVALRIQRAMVAR